MFRTIVAASVVFAFAAFALRHPTISGPMEEPILLLVMGTLFVVLGKLFSSSRRPTTVLAPQREANA